MALSASTIGALARRLDRARVDRKQTGLLPIEYPVLTIPEAYEIQHAWHDVRVQTGRRPIGYKIGLTSHAVQRSVNLEEPCYGRLFDDMLYPDASDIPIDRFIAPRIEVELAFRLEKALAGPDCAIADVLKATDRIVPAVEIVDARIEQVDKASGRTRNIRDTLADNLAGAGLVLAEYAVDPEAIDLRWVSALLYRNGVIEDTGVSAAVMGHPALGPAWLANRLHARGERLEAGEIILAGSFTSAVAAERGDIFHVDYGPLGSISIGFC